MNLKQQLEKQGKIRWATFLDEDMKNSYSKLVDIFGNKLDSAQKSSLVKIMLDNSGHTSSRIYGRFPPQTLSLDEQAISLYPFNCDNSSYFHEGVHFLAIHGPKSKRLIKQDISLANILGAFFRLRCKPSHLETLLPQGMSLEKATDLSLAINPFAYEFKEHCQEEQAEAVLTAAAYKLSLSQGESKLE